MRRLAALFALLYPLAAANVTIYRDTYGVPHVFGKTDADAVYGLMYAQAEDNFWQLETDYLNALGRGAEINGRRSLGSDILRRAFEIPRRARERYESAGADIKALCDASAAGLNRYLATHPDVKPRVLDHFEPWYVFALEMGSPGPQQHGVTGPEMRAAVPEFGPPTAARPEGENIEDDGSNMWAIAPRLTRTRHAMLLINPHVGFFGGGQRYEAHLRSGQGLDISGFAILGTPYIRTGFNRNLGWSHTNNYADIVDVFIDRLENAESWTETIRVKTDNGFDSVNVRLRKTKHGPVLGLRDGKALTVRAQAAEGGAFEQRWAMAKAANLAQFKRALSQMGLTGSNTIYADRRGTIYYVHGNAIPRRSTKFDWTKPVDGDNPETEWQGVHKLPELPQVVNPASGWLQNCNSTPFLTTGGADNPDSTRYPEYMAPEKDTPRSARSRTILAGISQVAFEDWSKLGLDSRVGVAAERIPQLLAAYDKLSETDPSRAAALRKIIDELRAWDQVARIDSVAATLFVRSFLRNPDDLLKGLEQTRDALTTDWGTWRVAWGDVNRLQRIHTSGDEPFSDSKPSVPVPGAPSATGTIFTFGARPAPGQKRWYGTVGNTYVAVVEFGRTVRAGSLLVNGESADPSSNHYFDQAPLYSEQRFKTVWTARGDVEKHTERRYRP